MGYTTQYAAGSQAPSGGGFRNNYLSGAPVLNFSTQPNQTTGVVSGSSPTPSALPASPPNNGMPTVPGHPGMALGLNGQLYPTTGPNGQPLAVPQLSGIGGSGGGSGGILTGGPTSNYDPVYGGIPSVPDPTATAGQAISGNLGNLGGLYGLAQGVGSASAAGASSQLNTALPGASGALGTALGNTNSLLAGQIPADVMRLLQRQSAERGVSTGSPGSPNSNASYLQSLGLTSLGLEQQGLGDLGSLIGMTPKGPAFDPSSMLVNPQEQQMYQYLASMLKAAPIPGAAGAANMNALLAALKAGRGATGGGGGFMPAPGTGASTGSQSLGSGFGSFGTGSGAPMPPPPTGGNPDDPTSWMNQNDLVQWNQLSPDQQQMEQLMGYPSFFPGASGGGQAPAAVPAGVDASDPSYWDFNSGDYYGDF